MGLTPIERPTGGQSRSRSAYNSPISSPLASPAGSRRGSVSSIGSAYTDPGHDRSRQFSTASSADSAASTKSGFRSLFGKKEKKPKEKKDVQKIVLTSKHAAAVKTKMMMDAHNNPGGPNQLRKKDVKTANVVGTIHTGHMTAAQQEARHPHSGPPALHPSDEMPVLTRIISADEPDEEDEYEKNERQRLEYALSKEPTVARVAEHISDESAEVSPDEGGHQHGEHSNRPVMSPRPSAATRNSFGGRFHRDEKGMWRR